MVMLGALLLASPGWAAEGERIFLTYGYRYIPGSQAVDEAAADIGLALCGTRCNALAADYQSYLMTMGWRLLKVEGVTERVVALNNPFLDGQCVCTGEEYQVDYFTNRPTRSSATPGAKAQEGGGTGTPGGQTSGAPP